MTDTPQLMYISHQKEHMTTHLNGSNAHVDADLILTYLLERRHGKSDVIQIFDWSRQPLVQVFDEPEDILHLSAILVHTSFAVMKPPSFCFRGQTQLQEFCAMISQYECFVSVKI